jgi:hypothetical protein
MTNLQKNENTITRRYDSVLPWLERLRRTGQFDRHRRASARALLIYRLRYDRRFG